MTVDWFEQAMRPESVLADLRRTVPESVEGSLSLLRCRISRIRSLQDRWTADYELDVRDAATGLERTCLTHGVLSPPGATVPEPPATVPFGSEGWGWVAPGLGLQLTAVTVDEGLPGLAVLTDPEQGRLLLHEALRSAGRLDARAELTAYSAEVVTYKAGVRATALCRMRYGDTFAAGPEAVVAKVHHDGQGERSFRAMEALTRAGCDLTESVRVPAPLAFVDGLQVSIQEYLPHASTLKDLLHSAMDGSGRDWDDLVDATRTTAAGLAALHLLTLDSATEASWDDDLAVLRRKQADLASVVPAVAALTSTVPDRLAAAAAATPADPLAPAHHSFRPAQVLLTGSGVAFIDFDKVCRAEPACDIALFTAKLRHMAANKLGPAGPGDRMKRVEILRDAFLEEYRAHAPVSLDRIHLWEALELTSLVHSAAKKVNTEWLERCDGMLRDHLAECGW